MSRYTYNDTLEGLGCCELHESVSSTDTIWVRKGSMGQANFYPNQEPKHVVVITLEPTTQSQPSPTISYTSNERLEGLRCCEIPELVQKHSIFV